MSQQNSFTENKQLTFVLVAFALALSLYWVHYKNKANSDTAKPEGIKTQAVRWRTTHSKVKPALSQFASANRQSAVVNFQTNNPFVGKIKNGQMIDGSMT